MVETNYIRFLFDLIAIYEQKMSEINFCNSMLDIWFTDWQSLLISITQSKCKLKLLLADVEYMLAEVTHVYFRILLFYFCRWNWTEEKSTEFLNWSRTKSRKIGKKRKKSPYLLLYVCCIVSSENLAIHQHSIPCLLKNGIKTVKPNHLLITLALGFSFWPCCVIRTIARSEVQKGTGH